MYKVFLVEDDSIICQTVASHLRLWGYEVQAVREIGRAHV